MNNRMKNSHSNALFHYTKSLDNLISIIKEGFRVSYSGEQITRTNPDGMPASHDIFIGIPMVSFCDIPLDFCEEHISKYGNYAVGVDKSALIKLAGAILSPVHYILFDTPIHGAYAHHCSQIKKQKSQDEVLSQIESVECSVVAPKGNTYEKGFPLYLNQKNCGIVVSILGSWKEQEYTTFSLGFTKNYTCDYKGKSFCAYDECEWRIIIPEDREIGEEIVKWFWSKDEYYNWKTSRNNTFLDGFPPIAVPYKSIKHIIVPSQEEKRTIESLLSELGCEFLKKNITIL
ncbi:MAG TPA: abortive infection system antitoxin AbiGi family protein [Bacteroidales bacterium]|jgi:hypothetical protein|nr:abortive infection system antitoxin AbiGi family protein [Bacteroidales bacterium]HPY21762.1 abortive infection system antitoxin AbiGi family protein [Bacteroidales bacterium]HQA92974.1 abortive infection system antitoxin AbiGi family protein [Bacteroidales bacterium]